MVIDFESEGSESLITPEPGSALLAALGLLGVAALRRRNRPEAA